LTLPVIEGATPVGQETCQECHEGYGAGVHSRLAGFEYMGGTEGCEACHGGGSLHVDSDGDQILKFGELLPEESAAVCAKCHTDGKLMGWTHSEHALSDVACNDCHTIHGDGKSALKQEDPELCYSCHQEQQAKANFPSHHPVKEGKMTSGDCHNPHGELQTEELARDLCLECHARYRGPFVFEHAPVEEDCSTCHDPHGTVANNLLLQNEPFLCLQCHENHFHATRVGPSKDIADTLAFDGIALDALRTSDPAAYEDIVGIDGSPMTPSAAAAAYGSDLVVPFTNQFGDKGWAMGFNTRCTVCHSVVHGSDKPSQTVPVIDTNGDGYPDGGSGLTR
jgi:DmsE family decaheme c-type cytochrome